MPKLIMIGATLVTIALIMYLIGTIRVAFKGAPRKTIPFFLTIGSACDLTGTLTMAFYAGTLVPADWHGWVGYCALALMIINIFLVNRCKGLEKYPAVLRIFNICIMVFWIFSYTMGAVKM